MLDILFLSVDCYKCFLAYWLAAFQGIQVNGQPVGIFPPARVSFSAATYTVGEGGGSVMVCIDKDVAFEDVSVTIKAATGGSILTQASDLLDFTPISQTVSISANSTSQCFPVAITDDHIAEGNENFQVSFMINSPSTIAEPVSGKTSAIVTITDNDALDEKQCAVEDALCVMPYHTIGQTWIPSYNFRGVCEHIFTQDCLGDKFTLVGDFLTRDLSTGRLGLKVREGTLVLKEDGTFTHDGLSILKQTTNSILFHGGVSLQTIKSGSTVVKQIMSMNGIGLSIVRTYTNEQLNITNHFVISAHTSMSCDLCGLCGNSASGKLVYADGTKVSTITDRNQLDAFENSWLIPTRDQILHDARVECASVRTDTVIGDPLYEAAILFQGRVFEKSLCYEIHGSSGKFYNLLSDDCVSVNAHYIAMNDPSRGNIISSIAIKAVNSARDGCQNILIQQNSTTGLCETSVQSGSHLSVGGSSNVGGIFVKQETSKLVTVSVPNCENLPVNFSITCETVTDMQISQHMIRFDVTRGADLRPTSHGLLGQFWNVPITAVKLTDYSFLENIPVESRGNYDLANLYILTITPPDGDTRTFIGENFIRTWDQSAQECLYAGNSQGGPSGEYVSQYSDPVIEGNYRQYQVSSSFDTQFPYSQFRAAICSA